MTHHLHPAGIGRRSFLAGAAGAAIGIGAVDARAQGRGALLFVGTYTRQNSKGIYAFRFDAEGKLSPLGLQGESSNPSFLAVSGANLYAANEDAKGNVSAFSFDRNSGALKLLTTMGSEGDAPCHVSLDRTGKWLFTANYNSGSVVAFPVHPSGALGEPSAFIRHSGSSVNPERQKGPHAHMALISPDNRFLFVPDLGLDRVVAYRFDPAKGGLTANTPPFWKTEPGRPLRLCAG
jgi:6-phosphogluconolactonase